MRAIFSSFPTFTDGEMLALLAVKNTRRPPLTVLPIVPLKFLLFSIRNFPTFPYLLITRIYNQWCIPDRHV